MWVSVPALRDVAADFYPTPRAAVLPLIPYLRAGSGPLPSRAAGDGDLVRHLELFGLRCVYAGDIGTGQDALALDSITAAPTRSSRIRLLRDPRTLMHTSDRALPAHRADAGCCWTTDWPSTQQAAPFLAHCSDIVAIGRVKWIEGSKHTGKDNYAWYRFDSRHTSRPGLPQQRGQGEVHSFDRTLATHLRAMRQALTSRSDPVRGSARQRAGSAPITRGLALRLALRLHAWHSGHGSISLCSTRRRSEIHGGRLAGDASPRWYASRRILGADATNRTGLKP